MIRIETPLTETCLEGLQAGDKLLLQGSIYTARDAAHKRMVEALNKGEQLPFNLEGQVIYYTGPCPAPPGRIIGSAGPTTSIRMDPYTELLLKNGLKGMIGKGQRNFAVKESIKKYRAVYFAAIGGAGALLAKRIKKVELIAYEDLGAEAIFRFVVEDFPLIVATDFYGNDYYDIGRKKYEKI